MADDWRDRAIVEERKLTEYLLSMGRPLFFDVIEPLVLTRHPNWPTAAIAALGLISAAAMMVWSRRRLSRGVAGGLLVLTALFLGSVSLLALVWSMDIYGNLGR